MSGQLLPPPELAPTLPPGLPPEKYIEMWFDLMDVCHEFLLAGLRERIGPNGDLPAAYREWYLKHMEDHDRAMLHLMEEFERRSSNQASGGSSSNVCKSP